jgi:hypothetical protein
MKNPLKTLAAPLLAAFTVSACAESDFDKYRKPELIEHLVNMTRQTCDMTEPAQRDATYETRLRTVLQDTSSSALDVFIKNDIAICLDHRLPEQNSSFWNRRIDGVFYNQAEKTPIVALWDNGMVNKGLHFLEVDTLDYGSTMLQKFAESYKDGDISPRDHFAFAGRYSCGKSCTKTKWKTEQDFDQDSLRENPQITNPPTLP